MGEAFVAKSTIPAYTEGDITLLCTGEFPEIESRKIRNSSEEE
jgi:hypothetical protein